MGNQLKISQIYYDIKNQTITHSYDQLKQKIYLINFAFQQNHYKIGLKIQLSTSSIRFQNFNWKKSTVKGMIQVHKKSKKNLLLQQFNRETQQKHKQNIILSYQDINTLYQQMKNLNHTTKSNTISHRHSQTKNKQTKNCQQNQKQPSILQQQCMITPQPSNNLQEEAQQCCICFERTPSMVLPCCHAFCDNCTIKYIIQAQQKKCPQCRHEIKGSRQSVQKQIFTVIQQDDEVFEQVKDDILQVLKNLNPRIVNNIIDERNKSYKQ